MQSHPRLSFHVAMFVYVHPVGMVLHRMAAVNWLVPLAVEPLISRIQCSFEQFEGPVWKAL
jgi:hypothetical protein